MNLLERHFEGTLFVRKYPSAWEEMEQKHLLDYAYALTLNKDNITTFNIILYRWLQLPSKAYFRMTKAEASDLYQSIQWLFEPGQTSRCLIPSFLNVLRTFHGPGETWENLTIGEFAFVDAYANKYQASRDTKDLNVLIAALYRPSTPASWMRFRMFRFDIRAQFNDRIATRRGSQIQIPESLRKAIFLNYLTWRTGIVKNNAFLFGKSGGTESSGWLGIMMNMAGPKLGSFDTIEKMTMNNALSILSEIERERQAQENASQKNKSPL